MNIMNLIVDKNHVVGSADKMIYGHFLEHFHRTIYGGIYDPASSFADEDGFRSDVVAALKKICTPVIRWPGGCFVSAYNWKDGVGKDRVPTYNKAWFVEEPNTFGTDEFIKLCRKLDCEPYICTNAGTGTAEEMSDWVEYCNLKTEGKYAKQRIANGHTEPYNVKYWSVGNENWGGHEVGAKTSGEWGNLVREAAKMMHRVDPSTELSAASIADLDWNLKLLGAAHEHLDWVSIHTYWDFVGEELDYAGYDEVVSLTGNDIHDAIDTVRAILRAMRLEGRLKIAYDEWNLRAWHHPNTMDNVHRTGKIGEKYQIEPRDKNDDNSVYTMADAVFSACFLNACLKNCDIVGMANFSPVVNARGCIFTHKDGIVLRPTYHVFDIYANLLGKTVLKDWQSDNDILTLNDKYGRAHNVEKIDAVATLRDDSTIVVAVVNKSKEEPAVFTLEALHEGRNCGKVRIHTINGPQADSYNDIGKTDVTVTVKECTGDSIILEPHSVNVIEYL